MPEALDQEINVLESIFRSERDPDGMAFAALADAHLRNGSVKQALELLTDGTSRHPDYATGHVVIARLYFEQGMHAEAEFAARRVLELDPDNIVGLSTLASVLDDRGEADEALELRSTLVRLDPDSDEARPFGDIVAAAAGAAAALAASAGVGLVTAGAAGDASDELAEALDALGLEAADQDVVVVEPELDSIDLGSSPEVDLEADTVEMEALAPDTEAEPEVMDLAALAPDSEPEVMDLAALAPDSELEVMDLAALAPDSEPEVMDLAALAPDSEPEVMDLAALAPDSEPEVMDLAALAPDAEPEVMDLAALAPDAEPEVMDLAALAPDAEPEVMDLAALAPDTEPEVVDLGALAPDFEPEAEPEADVVDSGAVAPHPEQEHEPVSADELDEGEAAPLITRTLAELYVKQGFPDRALAVYRELLEVNPNASDLRARIAELETGGPEAQAEEPTFEPEPPTTAQEALGEARGEASDEAPDEDEAPEEEPVELLARDLAEGGDAGHEVDTPFAWGDDRAHSEEEETGTKIGTYFDGLLSWEAPDG